MNMVLAATLVVISLSSGKTIKTDMSTLQRCQQAVVGTAATNNNFVRASNGDAIVECIRIEQQHNNGNRK